MKLTNAIIITCCLIALQSCSTANHQTTYTSNYNTVSRGLKKIVVIDPHFYLTDYRKDVAPQFFKSKSKDAEFHQAISKIGNKLSFQIEIEDHDELDKSDTEYFNDLIPLHNHIITTLTSTRGEGEDQTKSKLGIFKSEYKITSPNNLIDSEYSKLVNKYGTEYFAITGIASIIDKSQPEFFTLILYPPIGFPSLQSTKDSYYFFALANVKSGEVIYQELRYNTERMTQTNMDIYVYDSFKSLKRKIKK